MKWYEFPDVRVKVTFQYTKMSREDYEVWKEEEASLLMLSEVGELADGLDRYGYDLFDVAWLNLVKSRGKGVEPIYTRGYLVRTGERSMSVKMRPRKVNVREATQEDLDRIAAASAAKGSSAPLSEYELAERDRMGIEWLRCHAAEEAYEVDFAEREEINAWRAHTFMIEANRNDDEDDA